MTTPQIPLLQGKPAQQSAVSMHICPNSAHEPCGPHKPLIAPGSNTHDPLQQSADVVHTPVSMTHVPPHTSGGNSPLPIGVHGKPQQSALVAQSIPSKLVGSVQSISAIKQRGMPRLSCLHVSNIRTLPEQQFALALHEMLCNRQMPPAGVQDWPASHRPIGFPFTFEHVTFAEAPSGCVADPQQSLSS